MSPTLRFMPLQTLWRKKAQGPPDWRPGPGLGFLQEEICFVFFSGELQRFLLSLLYFEKGGAQILPFIESSSTSFDLLMLNCGGTMTHSSPWGKQLVKCTCRAAQHISRCSLCCHNPIQSAVLGFNRHIHLLRLYSVPSSVRNLEICKHTHNQL